ncbi:MAG: DUF1838 family protein [Proteobacteria bacterium]|nr:DUF1838 family protein [Pseudomonadota bacterium]
MMHRPLRREFYTVALSALLLLPIAAATAASAAGKATVDLTDPVTQLEAYVRVVGDTSGKPYTAYAEGTVYAVVPGAKARPVFGVRVLGRGRFEKIDGGYQRLSREIGFYTDLKTGEILATWYNPYMEREVEVVPIQNDPVNRKFIAGQGTPIRQMIAGDNVIFYREIPLRYPNPLDRENYPLYSSGDFYEAVELFNDYANMRDLANPKLSSVPSTGSWSRIGPWLPWMEMGQHEGHLLYHARAVKPINGLNGVPAKLREHIAKTAPKFLEAPSGIEGPDETSWTVFKQRLEERGRAPRKTIPKEPARPE